MHSKIKVLIVDDASFMVKALRDILDSDQQIEVVGSARNGRDALEKIKKLKPDVITLDVDMPVMDGISAIRHIMIEMPVPIVMLSSLYSHGDITFDALRLGVVDFLPKPSGAVSKDIHVQRNDIVERVKIAAAVRLHNIRRISLKKVDHHEDLAGRYKYISLDHLITIGTTVGGPGSLMRIITKLPQDIPAAIICIQDISPKILPDFAKEFDFYSAWKIEVGATGKVLEQGTCYICSTSQPVRVSINDDNEPSLIDSQDTSEPLNDLFSSASHQYGSNTIGILMAGIGNDGNEGMADIKKRGGVTLAQETETCVYPNLTQCAIEKGVVDKAVSVDELANSIIAAINK
ncbi:Chemotaxis response regulator protein-glutamate methylesterase CheB [hydrothermal vent metagenome]|uniref:protein-glutamate methylesterase n=1 Tax=hydrothermal vent metagenome TaxID=652676 RepID=A0A3B1BGR4_9ZZZZ